MERRCFAYNLSLALSFSTIQIAMLETIVPMREV